MLGSSWRSVLATPGIVRRLMVLFLAISLIPCAVLTAVTYFMAERALERAARRELMVISEAKTAQLEGFVGERRGDSNVLGHMPRIVDTCVQLRGVLSGEGRKSPAYSLTKRNCMELLDQFVSSYGYKNILMFAPDGTTLMQYDESFDVGESLAKGPLRNSQLALVVERCKALLQPEFSDYQTYPGLSEPAAFVASPIYKSGKIVGVIATQLGNDQVFRVFEDYTGLGETGETMVGKLDGEVITIVNPLRHDPAAGFHRTVKLGDARSLPLQNAVRARRGYGEAIDYRGRKVVAAWSYLPTFRWGMVVKQDTSEAFLLVDRIFYAVTALMVLTFVVVVLIARAIARSISRPVQLAADAAAQVAQGRLWVGVEGTGRGEIGLLLDAIRTMIADLRSLIGRIQKSSITLMSTATEIAATARQQEQIVQEHGASTNEAVAAVKEISATSQELLRTMNEINGVAGETGAMAADGQGSLSGMDRTMRNLVDSTASIGSKLSVISERAANINLVVTTITKVADQTNLLSINAAIEAEKAGEYGLGFLVVAREIRRLADQTAVATLDIERMVKEMQYSVSAGVMEMDKFSDQVRQGVGEVGHVREQLGRIIEAVQALTGRFDQVTEGMRAQSLGADQIREAMLHISEGAGQTAASLREFNTATAHMRQAIGDLKDEVSRFELEPPPASAVTAAAGLGDGHAGPSTRPAPPEHAAR